jgi:hypothetical protein
MDLRTPIAEFAPKFEDLKHLARELRTVLFPIRDGAIFIILYWIVPRQQYHVRWDIKAFNRAICSLGEDERANV